MYRYAEDHLPLTRVQLMIVHPPHKITPLFNVVGRLHGIQIIGKFNRLQKFAGWFVHVKQRPADKFKFPLKQAHLHYFSGSNPESRYLYAKVKTDDYQSLKERLFRLFEMATFIEPRNPSHSQLIKVINHELEMCNRKQLTMVQKYLKGLLNRQKVSTRKRFKNRLN